MATPTSDTAPPVAAQSPPTVHTIVPAPIATDDQHVCFICLQNDADTPNATWVKPCPCSLEAHEECMLRWIAEMETSSNRSKNGLKCPACKAPIAVDEPYDAVVALRNALYRRYSRLSPYILLTLVSGGSIAGAAWYGWLAASLFAGRVAVARWIMFPRGRSRVLLVLKLWALSTIGPSLVIMRWLPSLGTVLLLPFSILYATALVARDDLPTWPPSPEWAVALMPYVNLGYGYLLHRLFGPLERRLNRALRGQPPAEDAAAAPRVEEAAAARPAPEARDDAAAAQNDEEADGIWDMVINAGRALLGMFFDWPVGAPVGIEVEIAEEFEFRIGAGGDDQAEDDAEAAGNGRDGGDVVEVEEDMYDVVAGNEAAQHAAQAQPAAAAAAAAAAEQAAPQAAAAARQDQQQAQQGQNQQRNNNNNNNNNDPGAETSFFTAVINSTVTSLLLPAISFGMGELIRAAAPKSWVTRPWRRAPTGLLQERWGRSLVGGCLFVVFRDAISLYTKYRRVQVKTKRKVRNVEPRAVAGGGLGQGVSRG